MTFLTYLYRSLLRYGRSHIVEAAGVALATAVTVGALGVGDSARSSLKAAAKRRLGSVEFAAFGTGTPFSAKLADNVSKLSGTKVAAVLSLPCSIISLDGKIILPGKIFGVDERFADLADSDSFSARLIAGLENGEAVVSNSIVDALTLKKGDSFTAVVSGIGFISRELAFSKDGSSSGTRILLKAAEIASSGEFASEFSLSASGSSPVNVFVSRKWLSAKLAESDSANILLSASSGNSTNSQTLQSLNTALSENWTLNDMGLILSSTAIADKHHFIRVSSRSIFIDDRISSRLLSVPDSIGVYTYFVNSIAKTAEDGKTRSCPYSFVSGIPPSFPGMDELESGGIILNEWLAEDIGARIRDKVSLTYFLPENLKRLKTAEHTFKVAGILPMNKAGKLSWLTPDYPGLTDADDCSDWRPSLPLDLEKIQSKDEKYWKKFRTAPKAFISIDSAEAIWRNRYGSLTSILVPTAITQMGEGKSENSGLTVVSESKASRRRSILKRLDTAEFAPKFADIAERAIAGAENSVDFGALFIGLSFFIIAAALILSWMLLGLGIESRAREIAILAKLGFPRRRVTELFTLEYSVAAFVGVLIGIPLGTAYCHAIVAGLRTFWSGAVGASRLTADVSVASMLLGGGANLAAGAAAAYLVSKAGCARYHSTLIDAERPSLFFQNPRNWNTAGGAFGAWTISAILAAAGVGVAVYAFLAGRAANPAALFFLAGVLTLSSTWCAAYAFLRRLSVSSPPTKSDSPPRDNAATPRDHALATPTGQGGRARTLRPTTHRFTDSLTYPPPLHELRRAGPTPLTHRLTASPPHRLTAMRAPHTRMVAQTQPRGRGRAGTLRPTNQAKKWRARTLRPTTQGPTDSQTHRFSHPPTHSSALPDWRCETSPDVRAARSLPYCCSR
ncbi:MAG: FtsX-like permease family protein [Kiritimatiellaeota bacterium]|nr:FtsX-like permease family protein [Kiritimatiellota bacterium]